MFTYLLVILPQNPLNPFHHQIRNIPLLLKRQQTQLLMKICWNIVGLARGIGSFLLLFSRRCFFITL